MADENRSKLLSVLQGNGEFAKELYKSVSKAPGNLFFSPISLHAILSLAAQGSAGETREAFTKTLHVPDVTIAAEGYKTVLTALTCVQDVALCMANRLFLNENHKLLDTFNSIAMNQFLSEVQLLNFAQPQDSAISINSWIEDTTNGKITNAISLEDLDEYTSLVLVNAVYFKGAWKEQFTPRHTKIEPFYINETDIINVDMMHRLEEFNFKYDDKLDAKVVELSYTNEKFSLIVILPNDKNGIDQLEENLLKTDLTTISHNMKCVDVMIHLPKFKFEQTMDLKQTLTELGLGSIFVPGVPDFSGMIDSQKPCYVSKIVQKTYIEVNEEGTEAAAETRYRLKQYSMPPPPEEFIADHPFIIMLQAKQENFSNILFSGRVSEPNNHGRRCRECSGAQAPKGGIRWLRTTRRKFVTPCLNFFKRLF